jgi:Rrf2 family transcriptional regulator, nitric oxide-sensitive transcriptional repressor
MASVVHISEAANLAMHTMILLAAEPERPLRVNQATRVLPISRNHLAKVMQRLAHAGLVASCRGPRGGFTLARKPRQITLLQVFEAMEGPVDTHTCLLGRKSCADECVLGDFVSRTTSEFKAQLGRTRLSDVAGALQRSDAT